MTTATKLEKTPLAELPSSYDLEIWGKLEYLNPTGSIKYRTARRMVMDAIESGKLREGMRIIEHTSGNTGIALAGLGMELGYPVTIVVGLSVTEDAKRMIKEYGAKIVQVDGYFVASEKKVKEIIAAEPDRYYWPNQVENPSSLLSNEDLGNEIADELDVNIYLASMGTGSTITGVGKALKRRNPKTRVYLVLPDGEYDVPGVDDPAESKVAMPLFDRSIVDREIRISERQAIEAARKLHNHGYPVGVSTGANFAAAEKIAPFASGNAVIIFPDHRNRYTRIFGAE